MGIYDQGIYLGDNLSFIIRNLAQAYAHSISFLGFIKAISYETAVSTFCDEFGNAETVCRNEGAV